MEKEFVDMINAHRGIIFKVCNMYEHDRDDRDDLFQEIVLQLWRSYPGFRGESLKSTWMYRVGLNTAISRFRKKSKREDNHPLTVYELQIPDMPAGDDENLNLLNEAIQQLSRIEKAIVMLYLEEKSYKEISDIMGISHSNVGVKINRIKTKLEKIIKKEAL